MDERKETTVMARVKIVVPPRSPVRSGPELWLKGLQELEAVAQAHAMDDTRDASHAGGWRERELQHHRLAFLELAREEGAQAVVAEIAAVAADPGAAGNHDEEFCFKGDARRLAVVQRSFSRHKGEVPRATYFDSDGGDR